MYEFLEETAGDVMTRSCKRVSPETTVGDLHRLFAMDDVESYPVVRNGEVIGSFRSSILCGPSPSVRIRSFLIMTRSWEPWSRKSCHAT
jgi:CBS-domain-containing membrane protein